MRYQGREPPEGCPPWGADDAVTEEIVHARATTGPGRPVPALPFVDGIPADEYLCVRLTAGGPW